MNNGPSWEAVIVIASVATIVPSMLLGWLHIRINRIADAFRAEITRLDKRISKKDDETHDRFIQRGELDAKFDTINQSIRSLDNRVGDFTKLMSNSQNTSIEHERRLTSVETQLKG